MSQAVTEVSRVDGTLFKRERDDLRPLGAMTLVLRKVGKHAFDIVLLSPNGSELVRWRGMSEIALSGPALPMTMPSPGSLLQTDSSDSRWTAR